MKRSLRDCFFGKPIGFGAVAGVVALLLFSWCGIALAEQGKALKPRVTYPAKQAVSQPVRDIKAPPQPLRAAGDEAAQWIGYPDKRGGQALRQPQAPVQDPLLQQSKPVGAMPSASINFEGLNNIAGVYPPDTCGDVGPNHYVQITNLYFRVFDKTTGTPLTPALANNSLWAGFGGVCETTNHGDPIVLYDQFTDRWLLSQFSITGPFHQCIAISQTGDPTGAWNLYDYEMSTTKMNDYPKFGVWPDGYYMSINQFDSTTGYTWAGQGAVAFDRSAMLTGSPAAMVYFDLGTSHPELGSMLPTDADGLASPPAGTPNYFVQSDDNADGYPADQLEIYEFHVDWATPANSTFTAAAASPLAVAAFTTLAKTTVPQPGTTQKLQNLGDRLMYRLQYRNFGTHQAMVVNHTVDVGAGVAGIRWYELRNSGGGWAIQQQGTYAGDSPDSEHRWMGSIAMDGQGNMALGYSLASATTYPSIRYVGRLAGDAAGTLGQGESEIIAGSGSQTGIAARWGDYSMMSVDPGDDCTFWYTQEYMQTTSATGWQTRVAAFKFPSCTAGASGTLNGTVLDSGAAPIAGATVTADDGALVTISTLTDADGSYSFASLPVGTYTVTAEKFGFAAASVPGVAIVDSVTTTQDFVLDSAIMYTLSGTVTDASTGWPLYAKVNYGVGAVWTNPATGAYTVDLPEGTYSVTASADEYASGSATVILNSNGVQDFALLTDATCSAPGYRWAAPLGEDFSNCNLPPGWTVNNLGGNCIWQVSSPDPGNDGNKTGGTGCFADADSDFCGSGKTMNTELVSPAVDCAAMAAVTLEFKYDVYDYGSRDTFDVDVSTDGGANWTNVWRKFAVSDRGPKTATVDITAIAAGQADVQVRFHYIAPNWDWWWQVDDVFIFENAADKTTCNPPSSGGFVVGHVYDGNTGSPLNGALIDDGAGHTATAVATPDDSSLADGFYTLFVPASGLANLTASIDGYGADNRAVTVPALGSVAQDFNLTAGMLSTNPATVDVTLAPNSTHSMSVLVNNAGADAALFKIVEVNAVPPVFPAGPYAVPVRHMSPKSLDELDASSARYDFPVPDVPVIAAAGDVIQTWASGMAYPWGVGHQNDTASLWLGNVAAGGLGGGDLDREFSLNGTATGKSIDVAGLGGATFMADIAYDWLNETLWQVAVGGDNCIYELDPVTMTASGNKICPSFGTNQRGLAYNPKTDTFFAGSWNDSTIHEFDRSGTILRSTNVGLRISGLAFNPLTDHLFVMINDLASKPEIYVVDVPASGNFSVIGQFEVAGFIDYSGAGLDMGCDGHLWAVDQKAHSVYEIDSGETSSCSLDIPWLSVSPASGSVAAAGSGTVALDFTTTGLTAGETKQAFLIVGNDTPYGPDYLPVTLRVINLPVISSTGYSGVTKNGAQVEAQVDPQCQATEYYFEYGTVAGVYDQRTASIFSSSCAPISITALLAGLKPGTDYFVRLVAINAAGISYSDVMTVTTKPFPWPMFLPAITGVK